jgi:hypothetical protein
MKSTMNYSITLLLVLTSCFEVFSCTTFLISGKYTSDGKSILFKNRDTDEMQNSLVFFTDGKYKYIGLVNGDSDWNTMVWGGYNETGFAIMNSAAYNNNIGDTSKFMDQEGVIMKLALQTCRTLADFEALLKKLPKPMGLDANFGVIDAYGGAAYYETGNYDFKKYDANDPSIAPNGLLIRTNHSMRGDPKKGFGFCRYNTAVLALNKAIQEKKLSSQYLFNILSRNLYHSYTKTDLLKAIPKSKKIPAFKFFIDYIPRESTSSAILIVGAKSENQAKQTMMWTILGFPLTSVAIPVWIAGGNNLPKVVLPDQNLKSPICSAALKFKEECFPITHDRGRNYINLSAVINKEQTGYMQLLKPIENEIFIKANELMVKLENEKETKHAIQVFYGWIDSYLAESYKKTFDVVLFNP